MRKIPTIFVRDWSVDGRWVTSTPEPSCLWVFEGEGVATRKYDGTCVTHSLSGAWFARREVKAGKTPPAGFIVVQQDAATGKTVGWEPIEGSPFYKYFLQAIGDSSDDNWMEGTYELCGPKINGNPEGYETHTLIWHAAADVIDVPDRSYDALHALLTAPDWTYEGLVFHHQDGRMAKIKKKDFPS